tara:strand:+ start:306 stop:512 length:207 start_codon:yes stop_codon:yes gene_type:complete
MERIVGIVSDVLILLFFIWGFLVTFFGGWNPYTTYENDIEDCYEEDASLYTALELANASMYLDMNGER